MPSSINSPPNNITTLAVPQLVATSIGAPPPITTRLLVGQGPAGKSVSGVLRYDVTQMLDALQKRQACENIGVGDPDHSFTTDYTLAKS